MFFWLFCLFVDLLVPAIAIIFGLKFRKSPPKNINSIFGYRTARSTKDRESWILAHNLCGNIWYKMGLIMLPLSLVSMLFVLKESVQIIAFSSLFLCLIQCIALTLTIIPVELLLKRRDAKLQERETATSSGKKRKKKKHKK